MNYRDFQSHQVQVPTCDEISMNRNVSPKKSMRTIKREKIKRNLGQAYKTLKGKCISDRTMKKKKIEKKNKKKGC